MSELKDILTKNENIVYQLETLASYEPEDLDNPEFEVAYESLDGSEPFATVCCVKLASQLLELIRQYKEAVASSLLALRHMEHESKGHKYPFDPEKLMCYALLKQLESKEV